MLSAASTLLLDLAVPLLAWLVVRLPKSVQDRLERQPWCGGDYPRGTSLWAWLNRPLGWRDNS